MVTTRSTMTVRGLDFQPILHSRETWMVAPVSVGYGASCWIAQARR